MMSAPQPYPTVGINAPAPDDAQIEKKMPSICVDYLSHNWAQEDVWQSWKAMTKRKNEVRNSCDDDAPPSWQCVKPEVAI